jgi:CP family cyanate transporter-like MFS transporter
VRSPIDPLAVRWHRAPEAGKPRRGGGQRTAQAPWFTAPGATEPLGLVALTIAIAGVSINLRPLLTSLPPLFTEMQRQYGLTTGELSLLAATPVACFGLFSALAVPLVRRIPEEWLVTVALLVLGLSLAPRGALSGALLFPATAVAASAVAVMNVLVLSLIKRRRPDRVGALMGVYLLALYLGAASGSGASALIYQWFDGSLPLALGVWAAPAIVAFLVWLPQLRGAAPARTSAPRSAGRHLLRQPLAWHVAGFMGLQSVIYYATLSWLPTLLRDRGATAEEAGYLASLLSVGALATAWVFPVIAHRMQGQRLLVAVAVAVSAATIGGVAFAPLRTAAVWCLLMGLAQGAALGLALFFAIARSGSSETTSYLAAASQTFGYTLATVGPLVVGVARSASGGWRIPMGVLLAVTAAELAVGLLAARPVTIEEIVGRERNRPGGGLTASQE